MQRLGNWYSTLDSEIPLKWARAARVAIWLTALLLWITNSMGAAFYAFRGDPWSHGDWLISYSDGFIRRGLFGEIVFVVADLTLVPVGILVLATQVGAGAVFFFGCARLLVNSELKLGLVAISLIPMSFTYVWVDPASAGRKEVLLFLLAIFWQRLEAQQKRTGIPHIAASLIFLSLVLSHEGFFVYAPLLLLISILSFPEISWSEVVQRSIALVLPSSIAVAAISLIDSDSTPAGLCAPILRAGYTPYTCEGAVSLAAESGPSGIEYGLSWLEGFPSNYLWYIGIGALYYIIIWIVLLAATKKVHFRLGRKVVLTVALVGILSPVPLFVIAVDWGRYLQMILVMFSIALMSSKSTSISDRGDRVRSFNPRAKTVLLLSLGMFLLSGLSVSDAQYRSIVNTALNITYYLNGGLTPGVFD
jgi:hypothetical protein